MTRKRDRFFALFGAVLFLTTASAFTIAIVVNGISNHNKSNSSSDSSTAQTVQSKPCDQSATAAALPLPTAYKPTGSVSKLEVTDLEQGEGPAAKKGDCIQVKYYGTLAKD